jgi:catechol 2,3-dioxygenase-like lactoylglutathione lyase family enzyme
MTRFLHTTIVARDAKRLADFYEHTLGCARVAPSQELSGEDLGARRRATVRELARRVATAPGRGGVYPRDLRVRRAGGSADTVGQSGGTEPHRVRGPQHPRGCGGHRRSWR